MKKFVVFSLVLGLIAGSFAAPALAKKKVKKHVPVQVDQKYFLRRDDCGGSADNPHLSVTDGPDAACWWSDAGVLYDAIGPVYAQFGFDLGESYVATDGVPFVLDASKHVTGDINLYGGNCPQDPVCSPIGLTAGNAKLEVNVFAEIDGEEKELGSMTDTFTITPGATHTTKVDIPMDAAFSGKTVTAFRVRVYHGGEAYGPGGVEYDSPASFISVPTIVLR